MTEYTSQQVRILKPDYMVYTALSDFNNFTPMAKDKVEGWCVDGDTCTFKVKGFTVKLAFVEKVPNKLIKLGGVDSQFDFNFWIQMKAVDSNDTRLRLVVKAKLNTVMKMMIGKKLQKGLDEMATQIATAFNSI